LSSYDPTDRRALDKRAGDQKRAETQAEIAVRQSTAWIMADPRGRSWMLWLLQQLRWREMNFDTNSVAMGAKVALADAAKQVEKQLRDSCPELLVTLFEEHLGLQVSPN